MVEHGAGHVIADRYCVVDVIGRGGVGTTYRADDLQGQMRVAVKQLWLWNRHDWKTLELFQREARVLAALEHPGIPRYLDFVQVETDQGPCFYLVQELAEGRSLKQWCDDGWRPSEANVRNVIGELLGICEYLHTRVPAVVHRDIKPANVIWRADGKLSLVDFGAVRDAYRTNIEQGSTIVGTYGFMAPEQFRGEAFPATDVYAVAATAVALLCGKTPADLPEKAGRPNLSRVGKISPGFADWLERALSRSPADRFPSATEARAWLKTVEQFRPKTKKRDVWLAAGFALAFIPAVAAAAYSLSARSSGDQAPPQATNVALAIQQAKNDRTGRIKYIANYPGHWSALFDVAIDPSGAYMATASADGSAKLWETSTGKTLRSFAGHKGRVFSVTFAKDGRKVLTGDTAAIRSFDRDTGKLDKTLKGHQAGIVSLAVAGDGKRLASVGLDGTARIWDLDEGKELAKLPEPRRCFSVAWVDSARIATGCEDGTIWIFDVAAKKGKVLGRHDSSCNHVVVSRDGKTLLSAGDDRKIRIWTLDPNEQLGALEGHFDEIWALALAEDDRTLVSGGKDETIRLWDIYRAKQLDVLHWPKHQTIGLAFAPGGQKFMAAMSTGRVAAFTLGKPSWEPPEVKTPVQSVPPKIDASLPAEERLSLEAERLMDYSTDGRGNREALAVAKRALIQNPRYAPALVTMARAEMKTGFLRGWEFRRENLERAHELLNRAEKLDPNLPRIAMVRGWVFTFQKNYREARKLADQASRKDPKNPYLLSLYMELDEREQKFDELLARARTFVESTDEVGRRDVVYRQLISVYNSRREWDASERMHRSLLNLKPDSAWVRGNFAGFLSWRGKHDEAIAMGKAALAKADYGAGRITLADCYARKAKSILDSAGPSEEIEELLEEAEKETRFSAETFYVRGLFHEKLGNPLRARLSFEAALKIDKDHRGVKHALKRD